jgi:FkbM family methyltransferase
MKILFITPHLSTGGAPQYLLRKILELKDAHDVYCIEYSNITGGVLVVQRTQIQDLLGDKLITLSDDKNELINYIKTINPDIVHLEELPEYFCDREVSKKLYSIDRKYKIIETSHDSSFDVSQKQFFPDRFVFVSQYQKNLFSSLSIPSDVIEYPILYKIKSDRETSLSVLGLDPNKRHFLNVGLFTSRKNQSEIIDYAKTLIDENVQFHFVGNQADNFKSYWEPLMKNFPSNCKFWGERKDVDVFYNAMDVFLFTSRGHNNDKETSPLVLREAIGWNMPILMYNLPVYSGMYNTYKNITWLTENYDNNISLIKNFITKLDDSTIKSPIVESTNNICDKFDIYFEKSNKIVFKYLDDKTVIHCHIVIKDIDSNIPIYHFKNVFCNKSVYWTVPIPQYICDFELDNSFRGFLIEFYDLDKKIVMSKELFIKKDQKNVKYKLNIDNPFDLLFHNYLEMFVKKNYDCYNINNLSTVIDIGANSGLFSKLCVDKNVNHVYAIEPNSECMVNLNSIFKNEPRVTIINKAISNVEGDVELFTSKECTTLGSLDKNHSNTNTIIQTVKCTTLEKIVTEFNITSISLLKLDVEGAEYSILENLSNKVYDITDSILLEYHDNTNGKIKKLVDILSSHGFNITQVRNHSKNNEDISSNYIDVDNATIYATKLKHTNVKDILKIYDLAYLKKNEFSDIRGVCHVGSHLGSEVTEYVENDVNTMIWVEANYLILNKLIKNTSKFGKNQYWLPFTLYNKDDVIKTFNISNNEESSSVLDLGEEHKKQYPHIHYSNKISVITKRFDTYVKNQSDFDWSDINMLVTDCQGADLQVLEGFGDLLNSPSLKIIKTEVNIGEMYKNGSTKNDIANYLSKYNFYEKYYMYTDYSWGDVIWIRK